MNDPIIFIRPATGSDIAFMVGLSEVKRRAYEKVQSQFWRRVSNAEAIQESWFKELLTQENYLLLVAEAKNKIVGFIIGELTKAPEVYEQEGLTLMIDDFCVEVENDWKPIGGPLLQSLEAIAQEKGAVQTLIVSGAHDEPKRQFLKSRGLSCASEWYVKAIG